MAENIEFRIKVIEDALGIALDKNADKAKKTSNAIDQLKNAFSGAGKEISSIRASFLGNLGANAVTGAFNALSTSLSFTILQAREFSRSIAEVNSILPKNTKLTEDQTKAFIALSSQYGNTAQAEAKAFYEIVSGGVTNTATAFKILRQSNEAAAAGLSDVNVTAKVLTSTFNAFAKQGTTINQITDSLFQAVKDGQTTFNELAGTLGRVSPIASSVGVSIDEVAGSIAFLTKSGAQTDQAITGLRAAISAIIKPSKEASDEANRLGIAFSPAALQKAGGFAKFLDQIRIATNGSSASIAKLFGDVNAITTVLSITGGNFKDFTQTLESNKNSIGATASAAKELKDSFDFKVGQAEQSIKNLATSFAVFLLPALKTTLEGFKALTGIGRVSVELDENRKKLKDLAVEYNNIKDAIAIYQKGLGATAQETLFATKLIRSQADGEKQLNEILAKRQEIRASARIEEEKAAKAKGGVAGSSVVDPVAEAESERLRRETYQKLSIARAEFDAFNTQRDVDARALAGEVRASDLETLLASEQQKIDAKYAKEVELTTLIQDEKAKRNALEEISIKKELDINKFKNAELSKLKKAEAEETNRVLSIRNNYIQAAANIGSALFKDGSKEAFFIQKGAALAGIAIDDAKARSSATAVSAALPPGVGEAYLAKQYALITSSTALALSGVAAATLKGFAGGGIVGATSGPDNSIATVRNGEMILNAEQQKSLFDMINGGGNGGGDIIIQVDGREIAKAVRSQLQQGFRLA